MIMINYIHIVLSLQVSYHLIFLLGDLVTSDFAPRLFHMGFSIEIEDRLALIHWEANPKVRRLFFFSFPSIYLIIQYLQYD